jgi:hypothetical protein
MEDLAGAAAHGRTLALRRFVFPHLRKPRVLQIVSVPAVGLRMSVSLAENRSYVLGTYAAAEMDLLLTLSDGASLVFDVGAFRGYSTLVMSRGAKRIVAVDPEPGNLANLGATVAANVAERVHVVAAAVGAHQGVPELREDCVEGGGAVALAGAARLLSRRSTSFLIEIHDETEAQAIRDLSEYRAEWADDAHVVVRPR